VKRLLSILFLALLLGPAVGHLAGFASDVCADEQRDCCGPDGRCDAVCLQCACCGVRLTMTTGDGFERLAIPSAPRYAVASDQAPLSAPPSDILHVPKSH